MYLTTVIVCTLAVWALLSYVGARVGDWWAKRYEVDARIACGCPECEHWLELHEEWGCEECGAEYGHLSICTCQEVR